MTGNIVIIGGGFAGFWAAVAAKRVAGEKANVAIVSKEPMLQIRPRLYQSDPQSLGVDLLNLLGEVGVMFLHGEAVALDCAQRFVTLSSGAALNYDRLVVATGSIMRLPPVPGAAEAFSIDTIEEAASFDRRLMEIATKSAPVVAVIGAGFTGLELALELRDRIGLHQPSAAARLRVVLIDQHPVVGNELGESLREIIEAALAANSVETLLGVKISGIAKDGIQLANGEMLDADAVVLCTGLQASAFGGHVPGVRDEIGRIVVDRHLQVQEADGILAAGDACVADTGDGHRTLQSCQHALQLGRFAGENAARSLLGRPLLRYEQLQYVTCLDLGPSGAVLALGWERSVARTGDSAKALKKEINTSRIYPPDSGRADLLAASEIVLGPRLSEAA